MEDQDRLRLLKLRQRQLELEQPQEKTLTQKVVEKANSISPELTNPVNMIPGVAAAKMGSAVLGKIDEGYNLMGDMAAEAIDKGGKHPAASAAVGGTIKNIPNMVMAADALANTPALAKGVSAGGQALKEALSGATGKMGKVWDILTGPGEAASRAAADQMSLTERQALETARIGKARAGLATEKTMELENRIAETPSKFSQLQKNAGKKLEAVKAQTSLAEKKAGVTVRDSEYITEALKNPKRLEQISQRNGRLVTRSPEELAKRLSPKTLYREMKLAQDAIGTGTLNQVQTRNFNEANNVYRKALGMNHPELKASLDEMGKVYKSLNTLPKSKTAVIAKLKGELRQNTNLLKSDKVSWAKKELIAREQLNTLQPRVEKMIADGTLRTSVRKKLGWAALSLVGLGGASKLIK